MKNVRKNAFICLLVLACMSILCFTVFAEGETNTQTPETQTENVTEAPKDNTKVAKAIAAAVTIGVVATAGAVSMGAAIIKTVDGISRQPEAEEKIRGAMMLGLVFIETAIIYALIVAILIIFVL